MAKMTFVLDDSTADALRKTSYRLGKPQSLVVREAIQEYAASRDKLTEEERQRMLTALDQLLATPPTRTAEEVDEELREIRARRGQWFGRTE